MDFYSKLLENITGSSSLARSKVEQDKAFIASGAETLQKFLKSRQTIIQTTYSRTTKNKAIVNMAAQYYNFNRKPINHCDFDFLINGSRICNDRVPFVLILVPSSPQDSRTRQTIRETWGSYSKDLLIPPPYNASTLALAFLLGRNQNILKDYDIMAESKRFNDIILGDFKDSYINLTRKVLMGIKWMTTYCDRAEYILKADSDIFIHIPRLVEMLKKSKNSDGSIYGHLYLSSKVQRKGKWAVPLTEYPLPNYPAYVSGNSYVISGDVARKLWIASQYMPYLSVEDVFITGVLPLVIDARHAPRKDFTWWGEKEPEPCTFMKENKISGNHMTSDLMKTMWSTQLKYPDSCQNAKIGS